MVKYAYVGQNIMYTQGAGCILNIVNDSDF